MIRIRSDESLFIISRKSIDKYPESKLSKILESNEIDFQYVHKEHRDNSVTLYIDADPNITKNIIRLLRGGKLLKDFNDMEFLKQTLSNLDLSQLLDQQPNILQTGGLEVDFSEQKDITVSQAEKLANIFEHHDSKKSNVSDFREFSFDVQTNLESVLSNNTKTISEEAPKRRKLKTRNVDLI